MDWEEIVAVENHYRERLLQEFHIIRERILGVPYAPYQDTNTAAALLAIATVVLTRDSVNSTL